MCEHDSVQAECLIRPLGQSLRVDPHLLRLVQQQSPIGTTGTNQVQGRVTRRRGIVSIRVNKEQQCQGTSLYEQKEHHTCNHDFFITTTRWEYHTKTMPICFVQKLSGRSCTKSSLQVALVPVNDCTTSAHLYSRHACPILYALHALSRILRSGNRIN